jgi:hypothetical protein
MEKHALAMHKFTRGHRTLPDNAIVLGRESRRRYDRTGHNWELVVPVTNLDSVKSSSMSTAKLIWNYLPKDIAEIPELRHFKAALRNSTAYDLLSKVVLSIEPKM